MGTGSQSPSPVPCRQSNGRSEDARPEHHRRYGEKVIGRDREVPRSSVLRSDSLRSASARSGADPRSGALLSAASRPRNLSRWCALSMGWRAPPREAPRCSRRGGGVWEWWPGRCLTPKGPEVTVRSTSPLWAVCAGLPADGDRQGRSRVCRASSEVEHAAWRRIR